MPAPLKPHLFPVVLHDTNAIPAGTSGNPIYVVGVIGGIAPGTVITTPDNTALNAAATEPLPTAPANTRRVRVQVTGGDESTQVLIREVGGTAGTGILLINNGSTLYGGIDGSVADLEAQNLAGPAVTVRVQFES